MNGIFYALYLAARQLSRIFRFGSYGNVLGVEKFCFNAWCNSGGRRVKDNGGRSRMQGVYSATI